MVRTMDEEGRRKFGKAAENLKFIDELNDLLVFEAGFLHRALDRMPSLSHYYEKDQDEIKQIIRSVLPRSMDAKGLEAGEEIYDEF
jgi:hypothetical protein